jgi:hypothetical protein
MASFGSENDEGLRNMYLMNAKEIMLKYLHMYKESGPVMIGDFITASLR